MQQMTEKKKYSPPEISYLGRRAVSLELLTPSALWDEQTEQLIRSRDGRQASAKIHPESESSTSSSNTLSVNDRPDRAIG